MYKPRVFYYEIHSSIHSIWSEQEKTQIIKYFPLLILSVCENKTILNKQNFISEQYSKLRLFLT